MKLSARIQCISLGLAAAACFAAMPARPAGASSNPLQVNAKLEILVTVTGSFANPQATYRLLSSSPRLGAGQAVVQPNGDIDLRAIPPNPDFTDVTEITFRLAGSPTSEGRPYRIGFQRPATAAVSLRKDGGGSTAELTPSFPDPQERSRLRITDLNDDHGIYFYCLNIEALGNPAMQGSLDPSITNR